MQRYKISVKMIIFALSFRVKVDKSINLCRNMPIISSR